MSQLTENDANEVRALRTNMQDLVVQVTRVVTHFDHWTPVWERQADSMIDLINRNTKLEGRVHELEQRKEAGWQLKVAIVAAVVSPLVTVIIDHLWR